MGRRRFDGRTDFRRVVLGLVLLAVSSLTVAGPSALESHALVYALTESALVVVAGAICTDLARDARV